MAQHDNIQDRLNFMVLGEDAQDHLRDAKPVLMRALPSALDKFYDQVQAFPETRKLFSSATHIAAAKDRQIKHWDLLSDGRFNQDYVGAVTKVGEVHARIGLEPRWYIGGYALLLEALIGAVIEEHWPKGGFGRKGPSAQQVAAELGAVSKATMLDMDFAISVYLNALEEARQATEARAKAVSDAVMKAVGEALGKLSQGDLTHQIGDDMPADYRQMREDFNSAIEQLAAALGQVQENASGISVGADQIATAAEDLSRRTEHQAASLEETAAALDQITATVTRTAAGAAQASQTVNATKAEAVRSGEVVSQAVSAMGEIERSSNEINQIIGVIDEIAFQTNLLALNAGVEAARAGDAGRGFAVVAQEVRALAQRSAGAAKEIKTLISASSRQVSQGVTLVGETGRALKDIMVKVSEIDGLVAEIANSAQQQATALAEVNTAVNQMDQVVQQNAAMVEETTAAAHSLKSATEELAELVAHFQVSAGGPGQRGRPATAAPIVRHSASSTSAPASRDGSPVRALTRKIASSYGGVAHNTETWEEF
ncbi:MAG TPA: globin-coupled sensor protein [Caulobacteraceae bacterium]|nr:globin-coupled sensor protein [Caulobacteraceae bacterium]